MNVDRRSEPRFETQQRIFVTLIEEPSITLTGLAVEMSGSGMRIFLNRAIPLGALLKVESGNSLILSEVSHCAAHADGFLIGLKLHRLLSNLNEVANLHRRFFPDRRP